MSEFFIRRPIFAAVVSLVIVIIGLVAMVALPIARYPEIAPPTVQVTAIYPGADAKTVAETVATPLEQEINGVEGMAYISSSSSSDGQCTITVKFEVGTDIDMAQVLVQNRVSVAEPSLPEEVRRQGVTTKKQSTEITLLLGLTSPNESLDALFLNNFATLRLRDELSRVPGVGDVQIFGVGDYGMRVWLDPQLLKARRLTTTDVVGAIREQNVQVAAGQIGAPPSPTDQPFQYTVVTQGRFSDVEEFERIIVKRGDDGQLVRISDVGRVELGSVSYGISCVQNGTPSAAVMIYQLPGANAIEVADGILSKMEELDPIFPDDLDWKIVYDSTNVIKSSISEVVVTLFVALILVVITVYVFLQSVRATLIPSLTIPVSLIGTFAVMLALGFSINLLTLFGLILAIGIVVDDSIVVVENVQRHLDESDMSPRDAAILSMKEVSGPVVATTLVLLAVFVPTAFLPGITGQLYKQFALTIAIATFFSSINALTLSPALAGILLRPSPEKRILPFRVFNSVFDNTTNIYGGIVKLALRLAPVVAVVFIGMVVVAIMGLGSIPKGFIPQEDEGWCLANVQLPDGASFERTQRVMEQVGEIAREIPGIEDIVTIAGFSIIDGSRTSNAGTVFFVFEDWDDRNTAQLHQDGILAQLNSRLRQIQEANIFAFPTPSLPGLGNSGGITMMIEDRGGVGLEALEAAVGEMVADANTQTMLASSFSTYSATTPQLYIDIDRDQVKQMGVQLQDVFDTLGAYLGSSYVNDFMIFGRIFQVRAQADAKFRARPEDILALEVRNSAGEMLPLGSVVDIQEVFGPTSVSRFNVYPSALTITQPAPGVSSGDAMSVLTSMAETKLSSSMGYDWSDMSYEEQKASGSTAAVYIFAVILVFLVLAAQYESWTIPIGVILAIPTALLGATGGLLVRGLPYDAYVQIGIVLLIGLAAKSAILIVEFAKVRREEGRSVKEAAEDAARLRFRAILMTAFSFILGVLPLVIAKGAGAESRVALGTTVFAGMLVATVLSVFFVPTLYAIVQGTKERFVKVEVEATNPAS